MAWKPQILRIGFAWDNPPATLGGGPAFGREILRKIDGMRSRCAHELFMVSQRSPDPSVGQWPWLRVRPPPRGGFGRKRVVKLLQKLRTFGQPRAMAPTGWRCHGRPLEETLDALFFLYPDCYPGLDIFQVCTVWDLSHRYVPFFPEIGNHRERARREELFHRITRQASFLITGTERSRHELEVYYGWEKSLVRLIPHPTPESALRFAAESRSRRPGPAFALYPAQFWPHKNHLVLLQAWKLLFDRGIRDLKLVFTGSNQGNEAHIQRCAGAMGIAELVEFRGFVPREELLQLYVDAAMLVYPSLFGPENLPPLEAFALGCPVLAAEVPGSGEQLGDAALQLPPRDAQAWAEAVILLRTNEARRMELIARGKERAGRTTTEDFVLKTFALMDEIADWRSLWSPGRPFMGEC